MPNLRGRKLARAKAAIRDAGCTVGRVGKLKASKKKRAKTIRRNPKVGRLLAPGAKVAIKLAK